MENKDIISKIKEKAYENVNKKLEEEKKRTEEKIKNELDVVSKCIDLINSKMIFKVFDKWKKEYVLATPDMFFEDYNSEPKKSWYGKSIYFCDRKYNYDPYFKVNGEEYYDVRYIIGKYQSDFERLENEIEHLYTKMVDFKANWEKLKKQEPQVKKLLEDYNKLHVEVYDDD